MQRKWVLAAAVLLSAAGVRADIVPDYVGGPPVTEGGGYRYRYNSEVVIDQRVDVGDFFTIYDFVGFVGTGVAGSHSEPANWVFTSSNLGLDPAGTFPLDDPTIPNLTWIYTGPTTVGEAPLGQFSALSNVNQLGNDFFAAQATRSTGPNVGTKVFNIGTVTAPIPEPTSLALGAPLFLLMRRNRRKA